MTQKLKGCLMSWFNQTANISLLHSYPVITPPSLSPSHSCFLVCVCVCHGERENGEKSKEVEKKTWPKGIGRPCWGMITELCRIKTSLHRHTHTQTHKNPELHIAARASKKPSTSLHAAPRWPDKTQTKRREGRERGEQIGCFFPFSLVRCWHWQRHGSPAGCCISVDVTLFPCLSLAVQRDTEHINP